MTPEERERCYRKIYYERNFLRDLVSECEDALRMLAVDIEGREGCSDIAEYLDAFVDYMWDLQKAAALRHYEPRDITGLAPQLNFIEESNL